MAGSSDLRFIRRVNPARRDKNADQGPDHGPDHGLLTSSPWPFGLQAISG
jgi:hypothetical protein